MALANTIFVHTIMIFQYVMFDPRELLHAATQAGACTKESVSRSTGTLDGKV